MTNIFFWTDDSLVVFVILCHAHVLKCGFETQCIFILLGFKVEDGMLSHSLAGVVIFFFFAPNCFYLGFNALLALLTKEGGNN